MAKGMSDPCFAVAVSPGGVLRGFPMRARHLLLPALLVLVPTAGRAHPPAVTAPVALFASGLTGPEGLAFDKTGGLVVGSTTGEIRRFAPDGTSTVLANVGDSLAGLTVRRDGRVLAAAFAAGRVWSINQAGVVSLVANVPSVNVVVETRAGRTLASSSFPGTIVDITSGTPVTAASGLAFPNGLAIRGDGYLYVAETAAGRISRLPLAADGTLGAAEVYATGTPAADGIAFDRRGNLLVVGLDSVRAVDRASRAVTVLSTASLVDWPSNLAFGRGHGFKPREAYMVNYGAPLGSGSTLVRFGYNHKGAPLIR